MSWLIAVLMVAVLGGAAPRTHTVEIRGMEFHPAELTVAPGDTIVWINQDIVPHTATAKAWGTDVLSQGQSGRIVARRVGTIHYVCNLHPTMHGTLLIRG